MDLDIAKNLDSGSISIDGQKVIENNRSIKIGDTLGNASTMFGEKNTLNLGTNNKLGLWHNTNSYIASSSGNLNVVQKNVSGDIHLDNQSTSGDIKFQLGTDTNTTQVVVQNNTGDTLLSVKGDGSLLYPKMTTAQRDAISTPIAGLTTYETDKNQLAIYNGTSWKNISLNPHCQGFYVTNLADGNTYDSAAAGYVKREWMIPLGTAPGNTGNSGRFLSMFGMNIVGVALVGDDSLKDSTTPNGSGWTSGELDLDVWNEVVSPDAVPATDPVEYENGGTRVVNETIDIDDCLLINAGRDADNIATSTENYVCQRAVSATIDPGNCCNVFLNTGTTTGMYHAEAYVFVYYY